MARPREFDEHAVLNAAMNRFWEHGYQATSMRDLALETGLTSPSLYNAFGDKRALFRQILERYAQHSARARIARLESSMPPKQAIKAFFTEIVEHSWGSKDRRGCLLVNSASKLLRTIRRLAQRWRAVLARSRLFPPVRDRRTEGGGASRPIATQRTLRVFCWPCCWAFALLHAQGLNESFSREWRGPFWLCSMGPTLHLRHRLDQRLRATGIADTPACHAIGLRAAIDRQRARIKRRLDLRRRREHEVVVDEMLVHIVGHSCGHADA